MNRKKQALILLAIWFAAILILSTLLFSIKYNREIVIIGIQSNSLNFTQFGFQYVSLADGFFKAPIPEGNLRLYYNIQSDSLKEIIYAGAINNVGNGFFVIPEAIIFPNKNDTWIANFELKDKNLVTLSRECLIVNFTVIGQSKGVTQKECPYYYG